MTITKQELQNILDSKNYVKGDFDPLLRHHGGYQDIIFKRDDKHYLASYAWSESSGIDWEDTYDAVEVIQAERVETYWKSV